MDIAAHLLNNDYPAGSKKIEKDRYWGIGKDRTFLSLPIHHFTFRKLYFFLSLHLSIVTENIYLFLSLSLSADWNSIYLFLYFPLPFVIDHLYLFLSLIYLPIVQILISLYILSIYFYYEMKIAVSESIVSILHRGRLLLHWS